MQDLISMKGTFSEQFGKKDNCVNFKSDGQTYMVFLSEKQVVPANTPVVALLSFSTYLGIEDRKGVPTPYVGIRPRNVLKFEPIK